MIIRLSLVSLYLLATTKAKQPSAPAPIEAPLRELPWGQLNFLHTTDTHGWHAGHLQEPSYSADWGDYISFAQRMKEKAEREGTDLLLVDTGDRIEGNGLYDSSDPPGKYTRQIFQEQPFDVICSGNHELYKTSSSSNEYFEMVPAYDGSYLASNLDILDPRDGKRVPFAQRYKKFTTKVQGIRIMAFGFLYDFTGNSNNTIVQPVKETIQEDWFREAIRDREVDLFVVTGHATARSEEFLALYQAIRDEQWDTPIMFFGGHLHVRDFKKYDTRAYALASGRYMETIGFQSISGLDTGVKSSSPEKRASPTFARRYVDNNLHSFYHHTASNSTTFPTEHGKSLSAKITTARKSLDLDSRFGCAPQDLWTNRAPYPSNSSIFTWLATQVMPDMVVEPERAPKPRIVISNTGAMRFDIFKGPFTKDTTYIVSPFTSGFRFIQDVPYDIADRLLTVLNNAGPIFDQALPSLKASMFEAPEQMGRSSDSIASSSLDYQATRQQTVFDDKQELTPGYTTVDDAGDDGDDTLHSEISFYRVPNCFEARVNTTTSTDSGEDKPVDKVDLVFGDFIQPWVLLALKFLGGEYEDGSTQAYLEGTDFTTLIAKWIQENWNGDC